MTKTIQTTISDEYWQWCKDNKMGWNVAINHGIRYLMEGKDIEKQLSEMQENNAKLQRKVTDMGTRLWELESNEKQKGNSRTA